MADFLDTNGLRLLWEKIKALVLGKADKVANATSGNFSGLDASGNLTDSGYSPSDFALSASTQNIIIPSVDGTIQNMTNDEIAALKMGDVIKHRSNSLSEPTPMYAGYVVERIYEDSIYCTHTDNNYLYTVLFFKSQNTGIWGYNRFWSISLTNINSIPGKADKIKVLSALPSSGMLPNTVYNLGELQNNTTFNLAAATDNTIMNVWRWTFSTGTTVPAITWPSSITMWADGSAPNVVAYKYYEIKVHNGCATVISADVPQ